MLILCPECGKQVSDMAEICPHCGIKIAGNIPPSMFRPQYSSMQNVGQQSQYGQGQPANAQAQYGQERTQYSQERTQYGQEQTPYGNQGTREPGNQGLQDANEEKKINKKIWIISFIIAIAICGAGYYFYSQAQSDKEQEAYEYAMQSNDPMVLQQYLSQYMDAPLEHRDSVTAHLNLIQQADTDWQNAVNSGSRGALMEYIEKNPNSPFVGQAKNMIDSIDYFKAERTYKASNDMSGLQQYLAEHPNGRYADMAQDLIGQVDDVQVSPTELAQAKGVCRKFFQAINAKDEKKLVSTVSDILDSFLGNTGATSDDVISFMKKLYKSDITNMNWHIMDDFTATKVDDGNGGKNTKVQFSATQDIQHADSRKEQAGPFTISAEVTPDGHITKFSMSRKKVVE